MSIQIEDLSKDYVMGELTVPALQEITISIEEGDFIVILGPSGSGKTTFLNLIGALDRPSKGKIHFNGLELASLSEKKLTQYRRGNVGFIFQFYNLVASLTAFENVELAAKLTNSSDEASKITKELLDVVGLGDKSNKFPAQLSGGEQQRVAIARALAKKPKILLADEPTGNIDSETTGKILKLLKQINKDHHVTMILITHNVGISYLADKVIYLRDGKIFGTSVYDPAKEEEFWETLTAAPAIEKV
ncbi:MAG: ABC transporter ATP-binding protein [Candidatus Heimdallarchaeota archaeon]|nr:MAG: ABC transporter ATP-binding protein [Candidatus Heimdallarchaeota archaeon]